LGAESQTRQDRELLRRIMALDVERGIGLGVTQLLRLLQAVRERELLLFHARQDVVAGAVENSVDACERIAGQALAQRFHDRNGAADPGAAKVGPRGFFGARAAGGPPGGASSALLAVTPDFFAAGAAKMAAFAGPPPPPINSTKTSISRSVARATGSETQRGFL